MRARSRGTGARRLLLVGALASGSALWATPSAAQDLPNVVGKAIPQGADTLFREATRALTKSNYRRAAGLFASLRLAYPRSPYVADSYYWQAFALQRLEEPPAMQQALTVLDEQQLRFPDAAQSDDVLALRARVESVVAQAPSLSTSVVPCAEREDAAAMAALSTLTMLTDPLIITGHLATLLAMRSPCATELRRSAVYLLAQRLDADGRRMLDVVATRDPDEQVRRDARAVLARPTTSAAPTATTTAAIVLPPRRAPGDSTPFVFGDTAATGRIRVGERQNSKVTVQSERPAQLVVLSISVGETPVLLSPNQPKAARLVATAPLTVDLRPAEQIGAVALWTGSSGMTNSDSLRRELAIESCLSRQTAKLQAEYDRKYRANPNSTERKVAVNPSGGRADYVMNAGSAGAVVECNRIAGRVAPSPPATTVLRQGLAESAPSDRYLVVLAVTRPLSMPWLLVRLGTVKLQGATVPALIQQLTNTLFDGHTGAWSGSVIPW